MLARLRLIKELIKTWLRYPTAFKISCHLIPEFCRAWSNAHTLHREPAPGDGRREQPNPLRDYYATYERGPGVWKWDHLLEVYHRHLARFRGKPVNVLEIGVYSGGSLGMWQAYFGGECTVHGVDIAEDCTAHQTERVRIHIGDQQDRAFWARFRAAVPEVHVLIDDGGHHYEQQIATLEEILPHMPCGSVYICEDIHGISNKFTAFATGLVHQLNAVARHQADRLPACLAYTASKFQQTVHSIHFYPYACVIEKHQHPPAEFFAVRKGDQWQTFLAEQDHIYPPSEFTDVFRPSEFADR